MLCLIDDNVDIVSTLFLSILRFFIFSFCSSYVQELFILSIILINSFLTSSYIGLSYL